MRDVSCLNKSGTEILLGKSLSEIGLIPGKSGSGKVLPEKITYWLYRRQVKDFMGMDNLPKTLRMFLKEHYSLGVTDPCQTLISEDNSKKYIFSTRTGYPIDSVYIPDVKRHTLCVSTQAGCRMGCMFCKTARLGYHGNLGVDEILNQVRSIPEKNKLSHIVFMGMGEPLDNYINLEKTLEIITAPWGFAFSPRNVTISTIGIKPILKKLMTHTRCNIAVSLHSPYDEERIKIIPSHRAYSIKELLELIKAHNWEKNRRVTFQYVMIKGFNDSRHHLDELIRILKGSKIRVNLMSYHPFEGYDFESSPLEIQWQFKKELVGKGISASIRKSRGQDIGAACGLLGATSI